MKKHYDDVSLRSSKVVTNTYSTSFSIGIRSLHHSLHDPIYAIYGFVRLSDEIVDSFIGYEQRQLLDELEQDVFKAIEKGISINPILHSFQEVVNKYQIDHELIRQFLQSMRMDLDETSHTLKSYQLYILGSAEVVGLMCLKVFCDGKNDQYNELKPYAQKLGSAFQKVNFLRDFKADYQELQRVYFPDLKMGEFDDSSKRGIEDEIEHEFKEALVGIEKLPRKARFGTYLAYRYYCELLKRIKKKRASALMNERVRVPNGTKYYLFLVCAVKRMFGLI